MEKLDFIELMRPIGQLATEEEARTFADYLFVHDVEAQVEPDREGALAIWVVDEDRVEEARALLSRFRSMPDAEEFYEASQSAAARRRDARKEVRAEEKRLKRSWFAGMRRGGVRVTTVLLSLCVAVALLTRLGQNPEWTRWFLISNRLLLDPARFWQSLVEISQGQVWRLFTPIFIHFTLWHLLFNLLWFRDLGGILEDKLGSWRFAGVVALVALASNLSQYIAGGGNFGGLSGVVYGVFGYLWVRSRMDFRFGVYISPMTSGLLLVFLALGVFGLLGPTANAAHFSGLAVGAALGWLAGRRREGV